MEIQGLTNTVVQKPYQTSANQPIDANKSENTFKQTADSEIQKNVEYPHGIQEKTIIDAIEKANKKFEGNSKEFQFSVHEKTRQIMIKVIDIETKEVIREFPPEKILDMVASMWEAAGIFVDEKR